MQVEHGYKDTKLGTKVDAKLGQIRYKRGTKMGTALDSKIETNVRYRNK